MKRRNNGAGHIRQKPDGRWEALYYVNGERRYITGRKGETAADVQRRLNEALHNLDRGIETPRDNRQTLGDYLVLQQQFMDGSTGVGSAPVWRGPDGADASATSAGWLLVG